MAEVPARSRRKVKGNTVLVAVLLALVVVMGAGNLWATYDQVHAAGRQNARVYTTNIAACRDGNVNRAQQAHLWDYVLGLLKPGPSAPPAQKAGAEKVITGLQAHVNTTYQPRDCTALYATGGK